MVAVFVLLGIAVVGGIALVAVGRLGALPPASVDHLPDSLPLEGALGPDDLATVRLDVGLRGYRQDEVDALLDRVALALAERDATIAVLRARLDVADPPPDPAETPA